jgi:phosphoglycerate dehydrogenase-like enzyme
MTKVLIADSLDKEAVELLRAVPGFEVIVKTGLDEAGLISTIPGFNAVVVRSATKITRPVIEAGADLSITVAEHTFGLMLGAVRNHGRAIVSMKLHKWEKKALEGTELFGKTLGIIGCGRIGIEVARRAIAFGMKVLAYDVVPIKTELAVTQVPMDELLAKSDLITLHIPKQLQPAIGAAEILKMKDGVIIVNVARGGVVDEKALLDGLNSGKVRAAALDVFAKEPPEDFTLIDHPNVTPIPHLGAAAKEGQQRAGLEVVKILKERFA